MLSIAKVVGVLIMWVLTGLGSVHEWPPHS